MMSVLRFFENVSARDLFHWRRCAPPYVMTQAQKRFIEKYAVVGLELLLPAQRSVIKNIFALARLSVQ